MVNVYDLELLQFFGFEDSELEQLMNDKDRQLFYSLMIVPRIVFVKSMIAKLPEESIYKLYKIIKENAEPKNALNMLDDSMTGKLQSLQKSFLGLGLDITDEYEKQVQKVKTLEKKSKKSDKEDETLLKMKRKMMEDMKNILMPIFQNSELLGDAILGSMVDDIIKQIHSNISTKNQFFGECLSTLRNFLNSNVFLHHILKSIGFNITKVIPNLMNQQVRLAKRQDKKPEKGAEGIDNSCIDFKYTSNIFEQLVAYVYLNKGYQKTFEIFQSMLQWVEFEPQDFVEHCMKNNKVPYGKITLQPRCSCEFRTTGKSYCDNPGVYDPKKFVNAECPKKCSTPSHDFNLSNLFKMKVEDLTSLFAQMNDTDIDIFLEEIILKNKVEAWKEILESNIVEALFERNQQSKNKNRLINHLIKIKYQYSLTKEDNIDSSLDDVLQLFNKSIEKQNFGAAVALYFNIMSHKLDSKLFNEIKKKIKQIFN